MRCSAARLGFIAVLGALSACGGELSPTGNDEAGDTRTATATAASTYVYDLAQYIAPNCGGPGTQYTTSQNAWTRRWYIPMGQDGAGTSRFVYIKNSDGSSFEEYSYDASYIRLLLDNSFAYSDPTNPSVYCDEQCAQPGQPSGTPTDCKHQSSMPGDYAYQAPRDGSDGGGQHWMPRFIPADDNVHSYSFVTNVGSYHKSNCTACNSWHQGGGGISFTVQHLQSVTNPITHQSYSDVIVKTNTGGIGSGEVFWYARNLGWIGYQKGTYYDWINGTTGGLPGPQLACAGLAQGGLCPSTSIPVGQTISLQSRANNLYVCADNGGNSPLIANRPSVGQWEKFTVVDRGGGNVALLAQANTKYVCADNGGSTPLIANRTAVGQWETFHWNDLGNGNVAFTAAADNQYVCADNAGKSPLIANRPSIGQWETFHWSPAP